jgi:ComF family protein
MVYEFFKSMGNWLLPARCLACQQTTANGLAICADCAASLPINHYRCLICARPLEVHGMTCGKCQRIVPRYNRVVAPLHYRDDVRQIIIDLKFNGKLHNARLLAEIFLTHLRVEDQPDCLVPIPLHPKRLRERGYNQSAEIARHLAAATRIKLDLAATKRTRHTQRQADLSLSKKRRNVKGAFSVSFKTLPRHVAIVDDVMTSGHTVNELAHELKMAGVQTVHVWAMARAGQF